MQRLRRNALLALIPLLMVTAVALGSIWLSETAAQPAAAQEPEPTPERVVSVNGQGEVEAQPDQASARLGVQSEAATAAAALDQNNLRMQELISATLELGIAEEDLRTSGIRLEPIYNRPEEGESRTVTGYRANNTIEVTVRDLDVLGEVLDTAVAAGGNTIDSIRFEVSDRSALLAEARAAAMEDAIAQAEQLTTLAGAELGEVRSISASSSSPRPPVVYAEEAAVAAEAPARVPVQPGTQTIEYTVHVSWFIR